MQSARPLSSHPSPSPNSASGFNIAGGTAASNCNSSSNIVIGNSPATPWKFSNTASSFHSPLFTASSPRTPGVNPSVAVAMAVAGGVSTPAAAIAPSTPHKWNLGTSSSSTKKGLTVPQSSSPRARCSAAGDDTTPQQASPSLTILVIDEVS